MRAGRTQSSIRFSLVLAVALPCTLLAATQQQPAQALARNSDIFKLGIDYAGVHLYGSSLDPTTDAYQSSAISNIDKWKSPVLIIQGDDDRNVYFAQTVGLVSLLRAHNVEYELIVQPDDVHDSLIHGRWLHWLGRMEEFLRKHFGL